MAEKMRIKQEKIGGVIMDYTYYAGQDLYSDGAVEDEMLDIAMNNLPEHFLQIIEEKKSWPIFYHFSPLRTNIIDWIPFKKTDKVLEIGSGCGAITSTLAKKVGNVTCIDLSKKRSLVNAYRNCDADNITIVVGNFKDIEPHLDTDYDYVLLIGVFEYGQAYIGGASPYEDFMRICNRHKKQNGRLVIAIENKFGLKYWGGCREDHLGTYFSGLEGYREGGSARTFTKQGLEKILSKVGIEDYKFYYPYPDYKFTTAIFSDDYLPQKGELSNNLRNFDRERVLLFDEKQVFDEILDENEFPLFSNSYLLVVGATLDVIYTKFSNDRAPKWAIRTSIIKEPSGRIYVEKLPDTNAAFRHLKNTKHAYEQLLARYEGTKIKINTCAVIGKDIKNGLSFVFCNGRTLESLLDECLMRADVAGFKTLIEEYLYWLRYKEDMFAVSNFDFIFPNILVDGETWHVIDYEWTFDKHISSDDIAFRAFYNYMLGGEMRKACKDLLMNDILGYSDAQIAEAAAEEQEFQLRITQSHASAERMRELIGNRAYALEGMLQYCHHADLQYVVQIFIDYGEGFREENSQRLLDCYLLGKHLKLEFDIPKDAIKFRIDPCSFPCVVEILKIQVEDKVYSAEEIVVNGCWQECGAVVFDHEDPNLVFDVEGGKHLTAELDVLELPPQFAVQIVQNATKGDFLSRTKAFLKTKKKGKQPDL